MVLTRFDPALPLHRLRMTDDLAEVRPRDLAFGAEDATEAAGNARRLGVDVADATAAGRSHRGVAGGSAAGSPLPGQARHRSERGRTSPVTIARRRRVPRGGGAREPDPGPPSSSSCGTSVAERLSSGLGGGAPRPDAQPAAPGDPRGAPMPSSSASVPGRRGSATTALLREMLQHRLLVTEPELSPRSCTAGLRGGTASTGNSDRGTPARGRCGGLASRRRDFVDPGLRAPGLGGALGAERCARADPGRAARRERRTWPSCGAAPHVLRAPLAASWTHLARHRVGAGWKPGLTRSGRGRALLLLAATMARIQGDAEAVGGATRPRRCSRSARSGGGGPDRDSAYRAIALNNLGVGPSCGQARSPPQRSSLRGRAPDRPGEPDIEVVRDQRAVPPGARGRG